MAIWLLKLSLTPACVAGLTLVGRRRGGRTAGLVAGLPLTSGPISLVLASERGPSFAAAAAIGTLHGIVAIAVFALCYAAAARRHRWPLALALGLGAGAVADLAAAATPASVPVAAALAIASLIAVWRAMPRLHLRGTSAPPATSDLRWEVASRAAIATTLVALVTAAAGALGPAASGALSTVPVLTIVLAVAGHRGGGAVTVAPFLRGVVGGSLAGVAYFAVVGLAVRPGFVAPAYLLAVALTLCTSVAWSALTGRPATPATAPAVG